MVADTPLIVRARQWVIDKYPYNSNHLLKALEWLDRIAPDATEAMRLAALTHDMERAFPGSDQPIQKRIDGHDEEAHYNRLHSARSARVVGEWLREGGEDALLIEEVERLIVAHEVGGWPEANLVQAADSLSFLETNIDLFIGFARDGKRTLDEVAIKVFTTYERIQVSLARELGLPMYEEAKRRLRHAANDMRKSDPAGFTGTYLFELLKYGGVITSEDALAFIVHDLRTPLDVALGYASLIRETLVSSEQRNNEQLREFAAQVEKNLKYSTLVITSIIQYKRISSRLSLNQDKQAS